MITEEAQRQIDDLRRELAGTQEMLAFVLKSVGEPVVVTKELITRGLGDSALIQVDDDIARNCFIFSITGEE